MVYIILNLLYSKEYMLFIRSTCVKLSQIRYSLVVILELNSVSEVQYKGMMTDR